MSPLFSAPGKTEREGTHITVRGPAILMKTEEQLSSPSMGPLSCGTAGPETPRSAPPPIAHTSMTF